MVKKRILFVDDESGYTAILKLLLREFDICVEHDPLQAVATALRFKPDLIFMDVIMPNAHGGTIAAEFKKTPALRHIPIVFFSASISATEAASNRDLSDYEFLLKPAGREQIMHCIERYFGSSSHESSDLATLDAGVK